MLIHKWMKKLKKYNALNNDFKAFIRKIEIATTENGLKAQVDDVVDGVNPLASMDYRNGFDKYIAGQDMMEF